MVAMARTSAIYHISTYCKCFIKELELETGQLRISGVFSVMLLAIGLMVKYNLF